MPRSLAIITSIVLASSCMQGPGFMKQQGEEQVPLPLADLGLIYVPVIEEDGKSTGLVSASESEKIQVVRAGSASPIAGTQAAFPPGSLQIDTAITIGPGESLTTDETLGQLELDFVLSAAEAVEIAAAVPQDAQGPFTLQIPLPDGGAGLVDQDPYANLIVLYRIKKVGEGKEFEGILPRKSLAIKDGFVAFETLHFGIYQAVITRTLIAAPKEVEKDAPKTEPSPRLYYAQGFRALSTGEGLQRQEGLTAWMGAFAPSRVGSSRTLTIGYVVRQKDEE